LLRIDDKLKQLVRTAMNNDAKFIEGLTKAMKRVVNDNEVLSPFCLFFIIIYWLHFVFSTMYR